MIKALAYIFVSLTAVLHVLFFKLESLDFMQPKILKRFGLNEQTGQIVKIWAFNQGFYNLFLALGFIYTDYLIYSDQLLLAKTLGIFIGLTITGAGIVLWISEPTKKLPALIQAIPAVISTFSLFLL